jgi:ketosteroid isomerase-like protein
MDEDDEVRREAERFYVAVNRLQVGDPAPMLALWSRDPAVTLLGPGGGRECGWEGVRDYWLRAARLAADSPARVTAAGRDIVVRRCGVVAYTCAVEEVRSARDGEVTIFAARATHIYRREADGWKLLHRHADAATGVQPRAEPMTGGSGAPATGRSEGDA